MIFQRPKQPARRGRFSDEMRQAEIEAVNFRRGATLSTYHSEDQHQLSQRQQQRNLRWRRRKIGVLLLFTAGLLILGVLVLFQFNGWIRTVVSDAPTSKAVAAEYYQQLVDDYFAKNSFERLAFLRRDQALADFVKNQAPEVNDVKITTDGLMSGRLALSFRRPVAMWHSADDTSYVDDAGVVYKRNYFAEPSVVITDNSGVVPVDGVAASARFLEFVGQTTAELNKQGSAVVERVLIPRGAVRYVEFYLAGRSYPFKAQIDRQPSAQAADILTIINYIDNNQINPQYVDVRVAGKAYWK
jgi:hypothetical protein